MPPIRLIIAGGGTGGHVFPAMALAEATTRRDAASEVLFVGSEGGLEAELLPSHGYPVELLRVGKLKGSAWRVRLQTLAGLGPAVWAALRIMRRFRPDVVVGVGGYASAPVVMAATLLRRPVALLEQNAVPGVTNRALSHLALRVVTSFQLAATYLPAGKAELLGNPIRAEMVAALGTQPDVQQKAAAGEAPCLLVLGGSQGARAVNELVCAAAPALAAQVPGLRFIHQTGGADEHRVRRAYADAGIQARVEAFIHDMAGAYRPAWLAVSRAGASTISELTLAGVPAVLVPYPYAADDHQAKNAEEVSNAGGALMVRQAALTAESLTATAAGLLTDLGRLGPMSRTMRDLSWPTAADDAARVIEGLCQGEPAV